MTYFEWAGMHHQQIIVPWRLIDGPEVGRRLCRRHRPRALHARLAHLDLGRAVVCRAAVRGQRLSRRPPGDRRVRRRRQQQRPAGHASTRDEVLAKGITINGLPILLKRPNASTLDIEQLDIYYEDCVIGGPGAFVIPIRERDAVQGGDPHQARAGDRRPHARTADRAGSRGRAAHLLHHRRAPVAGAMGELGRG